MYRAFILSLLAFLAGTAATYLAILIGVTTFWEMTGVHDRDGGGAMALAFVIGPALALPAGLAIAIFTWVRLRRRAGPSDAASMHKDRRKFAIFGAAVAGWIIGLYLARLAVQLAAMTYDTWWKAALHAWLPDIVAVICAVMAGFLAARLARGASGLPG